MKKRRERHSIPGLNMTSTADISFMLLIFFLVTTSMDADRGLLRQLPPPDDASRQVEGDVSREHLLSLSLEADGSLVADGDTVPLSLLRRKSADFILAQGRDHLITLRTSPDAIYKVYFEIQNQIALAYDDARDRLSQERFGKTLKACSFEEQEELFDALPHRVAEEFQAE